MTDKYDNKSILVLGVHLKSEGYPNVLYRIADIEKTFLRYEEINIPMWRERDIGTSDRYGFFKNAMQGLKAHGLTFSAYLTRKSVDVVYIPYPAIFLCAMLSFLPKKLRPKCLVIDAFISIYDTVVVDRALLSPEHFMARTLKKIEKRAFEMADVVITDTAINSSYYAEMFGLPKHKFTAIPLSSNEFDFKPEPYSYDKGDICNVLFVGTFIPLHGISTIVEAIYLLKDNARIFFTLIGNGQESTKVKKLYDENLENFRWISDWRAANEIAEFIEQSDICLGIFGGTEKAARVCPYKIYAYAACGRPIITSVSKLLTDPAGVIDGETFVFVEPANPVALAEAITALANNTDRRQVLSLNSMRYYEKYLSNSVAAFLFEKCINNFKN